MSEKKLTALEELEDMGFKIADYSTKEDTDGLKKIYLCIQFYDDESWVIDSMDETGGLNATLDSGMDLRKMFPILKECRDLFLKALKEKKEG